MACRLVGAKTLSEPTLGYYYMNKLKWNLNQNWNTFIQEKAFESIVCEMAAILSQPQCVKSPRRVARRVIHHTDSITHVLIPVLHVLINRTHWHQWPKSSASGHIYIQERCMHSHEIHNHQRLTMTWTTIGLRLYVEQNFIFRKFGKSTV